MAEQQKIHPVDLEAANAPKATTPLVPPGATRSDNFNPAAPPPRRSIPVSHSLPPKKRGNCFCRCLCCSLLTLIIIIIAIAAAAGILYLIFRPKLPSYSVDRLRITAFSIDPNFAARATFDLTVTANNPNKKIGIYYEDGSHLSVLYDDTTLCTGSFPVFYQGHRNKTTVTTVLDGQAQLGSQLFSALQQQQQTGSVPLRFKGDVPVKLKLGGLKLWKVTARVRCDLVVNSLTAGNLISLKTSNCKFRLKL
ncbi:NDR1/HIN1-like protein 6 [Dendrobium catenatum]|uniref:Protein NDR1 n=1 Tax=Dendrobium catenatum TaxID=906689 RepID=A0A2I0WER3_9ASPA|nr:NDR1/HIN1-like protein 6 [Dendrobium catenatum]PKU74161.1 Protein NDR1 [Dendrobium catenatum]